MWETPSLSKLQEAIDDSNYPIGMRMRAAYYLRQLYDTASKNNTDNDNKDENGIQNVVIDTLAKGLCNPAHGSLMRHEFAYVMGQLRDERCCTSLEHILASDSDCIMVRHEAAEALGAIGSSSSKVVLEETRNANLSVPELADTCLLALNFIEWKETKQGKEGTGTETTATTHNENEADAPPACACMLNPYSSVDPAPPHPSHVSKTNQELGSILSNAKLPMFERYRAMFSLRNRGGAEAVQELCHTLTQDTSSALLRHEVAYVLGQMQHPDAVEALVESLRRQGEHEMVRHESAEALGAIDGGRWMTDVEPVLEEFTKDHNIVVRESCMVALDAADYWGHSATTTTSAHDEEEQDTHNSDADDENTKKDNALSNNEEKKEKDNHDDDTARSFVKQKAVTNGKSTSTNNSTGTANRNNGVLINHFNVQT